MTKIINLDSLKKPSPVKIIVDGNEHEMQPATVQTYIDNMKAIEGLGLNASPLDEIEVIIGIVLRAFPTLSDADVRSWSVEQIQSLSDIARGVNGEVASTDEQAIEEANETGKSLPAS